jgi:trimethylamine--corrinoid protein Co-methyltransferase
MTGRRASRGGGRAGRLGARATDKTAAERTAIYRAIRNPYAPIEILSADQVEAVHQAALGVLAEIGLKVLLPEAREIYCRAGAECAGGEDRIRFPPEMIEGAIAPAPGNFNLHARNPARNLEIGERNVAFCTVGGPPYVADLDRGRRPGSLRDLHDYIRLAQSFDVIHIMATVVEPMDVEMPYRHLEMALAYLRYSDKPFFVYSRGRDSIADSLEMIRISRGVDWPRFETEPSCYTVVNMNSPLQLDVPMGEGIIDMARAGQPSIITPFTLAGAMAPITIPGALVQQHAEAMAGIALAQLVRPGAPVVYGGFTSNVDMRSGAPAFGTPEYAQAALIGGQLARRLKLPYRSSNVNTSNAPDAQAAYESQMSLWGALMGGCNWLLHGAGWLEGGLTSSYEKLILDVEMLQMMAAFFRPPEVTEATLGLEAMREVGPGGHFFGAAHTMDRYESAFYTPLVSDWRNFETWRDDGSTDATLRANRIWKETLTAYQEPPMDPAICEELVDFTNRRKAEGGVEVS